MTITYRSNGGCSIVSGTSINLTAPSGIVVGDLLVCLIGAIRGAGITGVTFTQEGGWTEDYTEIVTTGSGASTGRLSAFSKIAVSADTSEASYTWGMTSSPDALFGVVFRIDGHRTSGYYDVADGVWVVSSGTTVNYPQLTQAANNELLLYFGVEDAGVDTASTPGVTEVSDVSGMTACYELDATSGTTTARTTTWSGTSTERAGIIAAYKSPAATAAVTGTATASITEADIV